MTDPITQEIVERAFKRLKPSDQQLLLWTAVEGLPCDKIAARLGMTRKRLDRKMASTIYRWDRALEIEEQRIIRKRANLALFQPIAVMGVESGEE